MKNEFYKKPYEECEYTPEMISELKKCSEDPVYFMKHYVKVQHQKHGAILFDPYPYQVEMIEAFLRETYLICLLSRQMGKSQLIANYILWYASFHSDKKILVASNKNSNAMEVMSRIIYSYEELPLWLKPGAKYATKHSIEFDNGSKVSSQATTENTGRGGTYSLILLDELGFVPKKIQNEMWASMAPTISSGGKIVIASTPNGDDDLFANLWYGAELGTNGFFPLRYHYHVHPERGPGSGYKETMMGKLGELKFRQECELEMLSSDALLINSLHLINMRAKKEIYSDNGFRFFTDIEPGPVYVVGVDIATGSGQDYSVIQVLRLDTLDQVAEFRSNTVSIPQLYHNLRWVLKYLEENSRDNQGRPSDIYWSYENNSVGQAITALYINDEDPPEAMLISDPGKYGIATTSKNKILSCIELKQLVEKKKGGMRVNSDVLLAELKNFVQRGGSYQGRSGCTDDAIMATIIAVQVVKRIADFEQSAFDTMYRYDAADDLVGSGDGAAEQEPMPIAF